MCTIRREFPIVILDKFYRRKGRTAIINLLLLSVVSSGECIKNEMHNCIMCLSSNVVAV